MIKLIHGDCIDEMKKLKDKSIDLCLTDPPYGTTACKWDSVIPFDPMWIQLKRIVKDNGAIALFGSEPFSSALRMSNIKMFKYDWLWEKDIATNFLNAKKQPLRKYENLIVFYRKQCAYYPIFTKGKPYTIKDSKYKYGSQTSDPNVTKGGYTSISNGKRYPVNIIKINTEKGLHPTQKPVALLEYLIKTYTLKNETVLDFTMGSGSTGVACRNLNRKFIGIEKEEKYYKIAVNRIYEYMDFLG